MAEGENNNGEGENSQTITKSDLTKKSLEKAGAKDAREKEALQSKLYEEQQKNLRLQKELDEAKADKKKPGIAEFEADGTERKRKRPHENPWGLSAMVMPPLTKNRTAIYKMTGMDEINPATGLTVHPVPSMIPGRYTFFDRFEMNPTKRDKAVTNITGTERYVEDGQSKVRDVVDDIIFDRGFLHVNVERDYNLYVFMELHPMNISNRFRPNNAIAAFERIDIQWKSSASQAATMDLALNAAIEVRNMKFDELIAFAAAVPEISTASSRPQHEIRNELTRWAQNNPIAYYKLNKNVKAAIQINMLDAINFGIVIYKPEKKGYMFAETDEMICVHTASQDPMEQLVKFLDKEEKGKEWYEAITGRLNYWSA